MKLLECVNPVKNTWRVRWDVREREDGSADYMEEKMCIRDRGITVDSASADVELKNIRIYNRALSDDEVLDKRMVDAGSSDDMMRLYEENDILGGSGDVDIDKLRALSLIHIFPGRQLDAGEGDPVGQRADTLLHPVRVCGA